MNLSLTDPAARWTAAPGGPAFYAYWLIDIRELSSSFSTKYVRFARCWSSTGRTEPNG
jgi:hypothetical protein